MSAENWNRQFSIKVDGQHLLNLRAESREELAQQLAEAVEDRELFLAACAALQGAKTPEPAKPAAIPGRPAIARPRPAVAQGGASPEIGPIYIEKVEIMRGPVGNPWKNPLYIVKWDGSSAATFDGTLGKAAMGFWQDGNPCYVTTSPSPKGDGRFNLDSIRMAA